MGGHSLTVLRIGNEGSLLALGKGIDPEVSTITDGHDGQEAVAGRLATAVQIGERPIFSCTVRQTGHRSGASRSVADRFTNGPVDCRYTGWALANFRATGLIAIAHEIPAGRLRPCGPSAAARPPVARDAAAALSRRARDSTALGRPGRAALLCGPSLLVAALPAATLTASAICDMATLTVATGTVAPLGDGTTLATAASANATTLSTAALTTATAGDTTALTRAALGDVAALTTATPADTTALPAAALAASTDVHSATQGGCSRFAPPARAIVRASSAPPSTRLQRACLRLVLCDVIGVVAAGQQQPKRRYRQDQPGH